MYKAVIFDLDGTLLDTLEDLKNGTNYALKHNNMPERTTEEVKRFVGNGVAMLVKRAVPENTSEELKNKVINDFKDYYSEHCEDNTKSYDGVIEMLDTLIENNIKIAVVSNKIENAVKKLCKKYFGNRVGAATGDLEGRNKKPAPDAVYAAMNELNLKPEDCVYVGDSEVDVQTAVNCRMDGIAVSWGLRSKDTLIEAGAKIIADSPSEVTELCIRK